MKSFSSFVAVLAILKISHLSTAASIPSSKTGVLWVTDELPQVENTPGQDSNPISTPFDNLANNLLHILDEMHGLVDLMPADDPNSNGSQEIPAGVPCSGNVKGDPNQQREQLKLQYLEYYKARILAFTQAQWEKYKIPMKILINTTTTTPSTEPAEPLNQIMQKVEERRALPEFEGRRKTVSIYPDCDNSDIWGTGNTIDFSFDLSFSKPSPNIIVNVTSAFVRMYKKPLDVNASSSVPIPPNRNFTFVSVYFKNPIHRKDPSKKGTKMGEQILRADEERWTEWDIKKAIAAGFNNTQRYNRVTIKLADDKIHLPAREFFSLPINCSHITEWPQLIPSIIRESTHHNMRKDLPFIDMVLLELPKRDVAFAEKEQEFITGVKIMKQKADEGTETNSASTANKLRHKKNKGTEANV